MSKYFDPKKVEECSHWTGQKLFEYEQIAMAKAMAIADQRGALNASRKERWKEEWKIGWKEGWNSALEMVAAKMRDQGMSSEMIFAITGISKQ